MYLNRVEIAGFKSFRNRVTLNFDSRPGLAAIVGPNGSGKTTVADAIQWALGGLPAGRGEHPDSIFADGAVGTRDVAEVTLILDNDNLRVPEDAAVIVVTRRMSRYGDDRFIVNNVPRSPDAIHRLFDSTGLGRHRFAVVNADRIERLTGFDPRERREILEQAAGLRGNRKGHAGGGPAGDAQGVAIRDESADALAPILGAVGERLAPLFREAFGGDAEVEIVLDEAADLGATGIDIAVATTPGERPVKLHLLSGGERTLAALALVAAIVRAKGAGPIILDGVDGIVGDRYSFLAFLQGVAAETQVFVLTTQQDTMVACNRAYELARDEAGAIEAWRWA